MRPGECVAVPPFLTAKPISLLLAAVFVGIFQFEVLGSPAAPQLPCFETALLVEEYRRNRMSMKKSLAC
jgi:hypothetical protein